MQFARETSRHQGWALGGCNNITPPEENASWRRGLVSTMIWCMNNDQDDGRDRKEVIQVWSVEKPKYPWKKLVMWKSMKTTCNIVKVVTNIHGMEESCNVKMDGSPVSLLMIRRAVDLGVVTIGGVSRLGASSPLISYWRWESRATGWACEQSSPSHDRCPKVTVTSHKYQHIAWLCRRVRGSHSHYAYGGKHQWCHTEQNY